MPFTPKECRGVDPAAPLDVFALARLMEAHGSASSRRTLRETIRADLAAGAPADADGRMRPAEYFAWLLQRYPEV